MVMPQIFGITPNSQLPNLVKVQDKITEFSPRYQIMDRDRNIGYMCDYTLRDSKNQEIKDAISVTPNNAGTYAFNLIASLMTSKFSSEIKSRDPNFKSHIIESFLADAAASADERLLARGESTLFEWLCNHVCIRSYIGCRQLWLRDEDTGYLYLDRKPVDMRWTPFEYSNSGLAWVAPIFWMNAEQVRAEFPGINYPFAGINIQVIDYWDKNTNEIYVGNDLMHKSSNKDVWVQAKDRHGLGYPPFVIGKPATGYMLRDQNYYQFESPSIYGLNYKLYDEFARSISIEQTMNMQLIKAPLTKEVESLDGPAAPDPNGLGKVTEVLKGQEYKLLPQPDVNRAHQMATSTLQKMIDEGSITDVDMGTLSARTSAMMVTQMAEIKAKVMEPRLKCLANFESQLDRMAIDQYIKGQFKEEVGAEGLKTVYDYEELGDPRKYRITHFRREKSKYMEIANLALAQGSRGIVSEETIIKKLLQLDDPEQELEQLAQEQAENSDPVLGLIRRGYALAVQASETEGAEKDLLNLESQTIATKIIEQFKARKQQIQQGTGQPINGKDRAKANSNTLIPLMTQHGSGGVAMSPSEGTNASS